MATKGIVGLAMINTFDSYQEFINDNHLTQFSRHAVFVLLFATSSNFGIYYQFAVLVLLLPFIMVNRGEYRGYTMRHNVSMLWSIFTL